MKTKRKEIGKIKRDIGHNQEVLINEAYLADTIQAQSIKTVLWHSFVDISF